MPVEELLYVHDILLISNNLEEIDYIKRKLSRKFEMSNMGELEQFLELKIDYNQNRGKI